MIQRAESACAERALWISRSFEIALLFVIKKIKNKHSHAVPDWLSNTISRIPRTVMFGFFFVLFFMCACFYLCVSVVFVWFNVFICAVQGLVARFAMWISTSASPTLARTAASARTAPVSTNVPAQRVRCSVISLPSHPVAALMQLCD